MKNIVLAVVITVVIVAGVAGYYYFVGEEDSISVVEPSQTETPEIAENEPAPEPDPPQPTETENPETQEAKTPETIEAADAWIRESRGGANPFVDRVLQVDEIIRKVVTSVDAVSRSENPIKFWASLKPSGGLIVETVEGETYISPKNYERFTPAVEAFSQLETSWLAGSYGYLMPLFESAYAELGNPNAAWDKTFKDSLNGIVAMEIPGSRPALAGDVDGYIFKEEAVEELSPVHKLLIRMGPQHAQRVQEKLRELGRALE